MALAALDGQLDTARLRALPHAQAVEELQKVRGVGPWSAEHIVVRGCGAIDELPSTEPRVIHGIAHAYGLGDVPSREEALRIASSWAPFRMWIAVLLVMNLHGTAGWQRNRRAPVIRSRRSLALEG